jgi:hypothetical protein
MNIEPFNSLFILAAGGRFASEKALCQFSCLVPGDSVVFWALLNHGREKDHCGTNDFTAETRRNAEDETESVRKFFCVLGDLGG